MPKYETDVQHAIAQAPPVVACHKGDIFQAASSGMAVACSAMAKGQKEPLEGLLTYSAGAVVTLSGFLTQWQPYGPGSPSPTWPTGESFLGHYVQGAGYVSIQKESNDLWLVWQNKQRSMDSWCVNTFLGGTDSLGDVWTIALTAFQIYHPK